MYLGACESSLGAMTVHHGHRVTKAVSAKVRVPKEKKRVVYRFHGGPSLSGYEDEMGLGKFKIKNVVKSVTKAATQVAKVAVAPVAIAAASSLDAVGLRNAASKVVDATALNKSVAKAEKQIAKVSGTAIDVGAAVVAGTIAAPLIGSAAGTVGATVTKGAVLAKTLLPKAAGLVGGLFSKKGGSGPAGDSGAADTVSSIAKDVEQAAEVSSPILKKAMTFRKGAVLPGTDAAPGSPDAASTQVADAGTPAATPTAPMQTFSGGGGGGGGAGPTDAGPSDQAAPDTAKPEPPKVSPWLFLVPALFLL